MNADFYQDELHRRQRLQLHREARHVAEDHVAFASGISWPAFIWGCAAVLVAVVLVTGQVNGWW
jgi:hypothetical protein